MVAGRSRLKSPPRDKKTSTKESATSANESATSAREINVSPSEIPPIIPTRPSVVVNPNPDSKSTSAEIGSLETADDSLSFNETKLAGANDPGPPDLENTNEEQDSNNVGKPVSAQDKSFVEESENTELQVVTEQPDPNVVATESINGLGKIKSSQLEKAGTPSRPCDFHYQEFKNVNRRFDNLTMLLESNRNLGISVSILTKNLFPFNNFLGHFTCRNLHLDHRGWLFWWLAQVLTSFWYCSS